MNINNLKKGLESYVNLYVPIKQEKFENGEVAQNDSLLKTLIVWLVVGFAIYISFRYNKKFVFGDFLLAFFCAPCYILYHLAMTGLGGLLDTNK